MRSGCWAAVARVACRSIAGDGRDNAGSCSQHANQIVVNFTDIDIPSIVHGNSVGGDLRIGRCTAIAIAGISCTSIAYDSRDSAGEDTHLTNSLIELVCDINVAPIIDSDSRGSIEFRAGGRSTIA